MRSFNQNSFSLVRYPQIFSAQTTKKKTITYLLPPIFTPLLPLRPRRPRMNMTGIEKQGAPDHKFQFNQGTGEKTFKTERQQDFSLNWDLTMHRAYDYQLVRFHQVDPLADQGGQESLTSYQYGWNNPARYNDPWGDCPTCPPNSIGRIGEGIARAFSNAVGKVFPSNNKNASLSRDQPGGMNISVDGAATSGTDTKATKGNDWGELPSFLIPPTMSEIILVIKDFFADGDESSNDAFTSDASTQERTDNSSSSEESKSDKNRSSKPARAYNTKFLDPPGNESYGPERLIGDSLKTRFTTTENGETFSDTVRIENQ